jgi:MOSC domain-containing protein YiiM
MARLLSVNVGLPRDIEWKGRTVHTGIWKNPVPGCCRVGRLNLDGDGQGDLAGHGGEQRAVFVYQIESYRYWQEQLTRTDFVHGQFGENFTIEASATVIKSAARCLKSLNLALLATASAFGLTNLGCRLC